MSICLCPIYEVVQGIRRVVASIITFGTGWRWVLNTLQRTGDADLRF